MSILFIAVFTDAYQLIQNSPIKSILSHSHHSSPQTNSCVADNPSTNQSSLHYQTYAAIPRESLPTESSPMRSLLHCNRGWIQLQPMAHIIHLQEPQQHSMSNENSDEYHHLLQQQQQRQQLPLQLATVHG